MSNSRPPAEENKKLFIISSRKLNQDEITCLSFHGILVTIQKIHTVCTLNDVTSTGDFFIADISDYTVRKWLELNRANILRNHHYCFLRSFHENNNPGWVQDIVGGEKELSNVCSVLKEIVFIKDTQQFIDYLLNYSKISKPESIGKWVWNKVCRVFRFFVCNS